MPTPATQPLLDALDAARIQHDTDRANLDAIIATIAKDNTVLASAQTAEQASHQAFRDAVKALETELDAEVA